MTDYVAQAREQGRKAFLDGKPYTDCPYLPFPDCKEGMAWKNAWLAAKEQARSNRQCLKR